MNQQVYFVGTDSEIGHHAAPLKGLVDFKIVEPENSDVIQPGDLAVFYSEHFERFRNAIRKLQERDVATLYMIDGILEWRNAWENRDDEPACPFTMRPVLCDKVACIGRSQAQVLASWGNESKIEVVGVPRFDTLQNLQPKKGNAKKRVLVMSAKCPAFDQQQRAQIVASLRDLKAELDSRDVEVVWRLTAGLTEEIGAATDQTNTTDFTGRQLAEVLQQVDAVVTTPSTAMLEAMLLDLPVAILDYTNSPSYVHSAWRISADAQMAQALSELLEPTETKLVLQRYLLDEALFVVGSASERMQKLINDMLEVTALAINNQTAIEFPAGMLPYPAWASADSVGFDHKTLFPYAAFQSNDSIAVQADLAHARREIEHLHHEIAQLQSELGQAHEIFEEIHRHPVAGPIVRTRQRIIDFFKRIRKSGNATSSGAVGQ